LAPPHGLSVPRGHGRDFAAGARLHGDRPLPLDGDRVPRGLGALVRRLRLRVPGGRRGRRVGGGHLHVFVLVVGRRLVGEIVRGASSVVGGDDLLVGGRLVV